MLIAILLPWSTSGVAIVAVLWFVALIPTIELRALSRSLMRPISALPIALFALALVGTLWSDASWGARLHAVSPTAKLLVLPLLLYHFQRSPRGMWVFVAFLVSCTLLMLVSWAVAFDPGLTLKPEAECAGDLRQELHRPEPGIRAVRGGAGLSDHDVTAGRPDAARAAADGDRARPARQHDVRGGVAHRAGDHADHAGGVRAAAPEVAHQPHDFHRGGGRLGAGLGDVAAVAWTTTTFIRDYQIYKELNQPTSIGVRLEFWQKSLRFIAEAPVIGHGTGSTRGLFEQAATGPKVLAGGQVVSNPHNQTLHVAIQWGVIGVIVLYAIWWLHLSLFRGEGLAAWIGLMVVVQNIFTSLFNSHLFDFHQGWMYVLGVGVAGGMVLATRRNAETAASHPP